MSPVTVLPRTFAWCRLISMASAVMLTGMVVHWEPQETRSATVCLSRVTVTVGLENNIVLGAAFPEKVRVLPINPPPRVNDPKLASPETKLERMPNTCEKFALEWMSLAESDKPSTLIMPKGERGFDVSRNSHDSVLDSE